MRSGAHPSQRDTAASGRAAHPATSRPDRNEWANSPPRNSHGELGPSMTNQEIPIETATTAAAALNPRERASRVTAERNGAAANIAPKRRLLARVSVPKYTRVGSVTLNSLIIWPKESSEATTQTMMRVRCTWRLRQAINAMTSGQTA